MQGGIGHVPSTTPLYVDPSRDIPFEATWQRWVSLQDGIADRPRSEQRLVHCATRGGFGQFVSNVIGCVALAILTDRRLLVSYDVNPVLEGVWQPERYEAEVWSVFDAHGLRLSDWGGGIDRDSLLSEFSGYARTHNLMNPFQLLHADQLLCADFTTLPSLANASLLLWPYESSVLPMLTANTRIRQRMLMLAHGAVDSLGMPLLSELIGPRIFRPADSIRRDLERLVALAAHTTRVALQVRVAPWGWVAKGGSVLVDYPDRENTPYVAARCGYMSIPAAEREAPVTMFVVGDVAESVLSVLLLMYRAEGRVVHATNAAWLADLSPSAALLLRNTTSHPGLEAWLRGTMPHVAVLVFASGSQLIGFHPPRDIAELGTATGMGRAVLEMWLLAQCSHVVLSENSNFGSIASALFPRDKKVQLVTRGRSPRCYPAMLGKFDGSMTSGQAQGTSCWNDKLHMIESMGWLEAQSNLTAM
jgi:hypothetical protein